MATRITDVDREAVVALLRRHLIDDRISLDEYADLVESVWGADSRETMDAVLVDLPLLPPAASERNGRRHGEDHIPSATWRPTRERFRDPTTSRVMRVWVDAGDGSRHYVQDQ